jgi:hypothetical protein
MPTKPETSAYKLKGSGQFVDGEWSHYDILSTEGKTPVGACTQRSGGGWVCTLPIRDQETRRKIGVAYGRGTTPESALADAQVNQQEMS